jgi:hypothetical protein
MQTRRGGGIAWEIDDQEVTQYEARVRRWGNCPDRTGKSRPAHSAAPGNLPCVWPAADPSSMSPRLSFASPQPGFRFKPLPRAIMCQYHAHTRHCWKNSSYMELPTPQLGWCWHRMNSQDRWTRHAIHCSQNRDSVPSKWQIPTLSMLG